MNSDWVKWLEPLCYPVGFVWLLLVATTVVLLLKRRWIRALWPALLAAILSAFGSSPLSYQLLATLEQPYARTHLQDLPIADAVVMLGGTVNPSSNDPFGGDFSEAADRAITAAELIRQKKSRILILGGGGESARPKVRENIVLDQWLKTWGLAPAQTILLDPSRNTHDEAMQVQALMKKNNWKKILLVTSAYHMKRAQALFHSAGIPVIPAPCDFIGLGSLESNIPLRPVPVVERLQAAQLYLHEAIGFLFYRLKGWIRTDSSTPAVPALSVSQRAGISRP